MNTVETIRRKTRALKRRYRGPALEHRVDPWRRATRGARLRPTFLVIGEMKCGTSSLYNWLLEHPAIGGYPHKEVCYFDTRYGEGDDWYRSHFPLASFRTRVLREYGIAPAVGEASPHYLFHPHAAKRVHAYDPAMRLIVVLRDPVERSYSHYQHARRRGKETLDFERAIELEDDRLRAERAALTKDVNASFENHLWFSYATRGMYADSLERWLAVFPREQMLVVGTEDMNENPAEVIGEAYAFLGLPDVKLREFPTYMRGGYESRVDAELRERLTARFAEPNARLEALIGRRFNWS